jgi:hypothetical protein
MMKERKKRERDQGEKQWAKWVLDLALYDDEPYPPPPAFDDECSEWIEEYLNAKSLQN